MRALYLLHLFDWINLESLVKTHFNNIRAEISKSIPSHHHKPPFPLPPLGRSTGNRMFSTGYPIYILDYRTHLQQLLECHSILTFTFHQADQMSYALSRFLIRGSSPSTSNQIGSNPFHIYRRCEYVEQIHDCNYLSEALFYYSGVCLQCLKPSTVAGVGPFLTVI